MVKSLVDIIKSSKFIRAAGVALALSTAILPIVSSANETSTEHEQSSQEVRPISELWVINSEGRNEPRMMEGNVHAYYDWSPDGKKIVYTKVTPLYGYPPGFNDLSIYVTSIETLEKCRLVFGENYPESIGNPIWSPNGEQIAYIMGHRWWGDGPIPTQDSGIYMMNPDGTEKRKIVDGENKPDFNKYAWSFDGTEIAYQSHFKLSKVEIDSSSEENEPTELLDRCNFFSWANQSYDLVYVSSIIDVGPPLKSKSLISIICGNGENKEFFFEANKILGMVWSPEDRYIAFSGRTIEKEDNDIIITDREGKICYVVDTKFNDSQPTWSQDGKEISFVSNKTGNGDIYVFSLEDESIRQLTFSEHEERLPQWSPDGENIAYLLEKEIKE